MLLMLHRSPLRHPAVAAGLRLMWIGPAWPAIVFAFGFDAESRVTADAGRRLAVGQFPLPVRTTCAMVICTVPPASDKLHRLSRSSDIDRLLASAGGVRTYRPGEIVFAQGDRAATVFYVQEGIVKLSAMSARGKEAVVAVLGV